MGTYYVSKYKIEDLRRKCNRIANKGANITFEILDRDINLCVGTILGVPQYVKCDQIEVQGSYKINGWDFVGVIEHSSPVNIIRVADERFYNRIPERYYTAPRECEHCFIKRDRNDTFLVYNEDNDEFKQVGRTCLKLYTGGLDAEVCAAYIQFLTELTENNVEENDNGAISDFEKQHLVMMMDDIKKKAITYVKDHGYVPGKTGEKFNEALSEEKINDCDPNLIHEMDNWINDLYDSSSWISNIKGVWGKDEYEYRDASLLTSAISAFLKNKMIKDANRSNESNTYAGNVGDEVTLTIQNVSVAYEKTVYFGKNSNSYPVYKIIDEDGKIYLWGCTNDNIKPKAGDVLKGKIKALKPENNRGEKITELTRCKILN